MKASVLNSGLQNKKTKNAQYDSYVIVLSSLFQDVFTLPCQINLNLPLSQKENGISELSDLLRLCKHVVFSTLMHIDKNEDVVINV